jgi:glycine/D-amino acid oxidase-like deaminating enzyme
MSEYCSKRVTAGPYGRVFAAGHFVRYPPNGPESLARPIVRPDDRRPRELPDRRSRVTAFARPAGQLKNGKQLHTPGAGPISRYSIKNSSTFDLSRRCPVRLAVVGAGVAGALLAWRVRQAGPRTTVDVYTGTPGTADASGASGGLVRGFERSPHAGRLAVDSLIELRADPVLRAAAGYSEIGSVYLLPPGSDPAGPVNVVEESLPGSARVLTDGELSSRYPFRDLPSGAIAVVERCAGFLSPARLRAAVLGWLDDDGVAIRPESVVTVDPSPSVHLGNGVTVRYDAVVIAAGAWTPGLLAASGVPAGGLTTKQIQYSIHPVRLPGLGAFVDDITGLYGRPSNGQFLLGLPCDRWGVDPAHVRPDTKLAHRVARQAALQFGLDTAGAPVRVVASSDCYHESPGLLLRETVAGTALLTFTGGSGGAAKNVRAASRTAAGQLLTGHS